MFYFVSIDVLILCSVLVLGFVSFSAWQFCLIAYLSFLIIVLVLVLVNSDLILFIQTLALYKSFTYLLTYLPITYT